MKTLWVLQPEEFASLQNDGSAVIGTMRNPIVRDRYKNFGMRTRGFDADSAFVGSGSVFTFIGDGIRHDPRPALLPVCVKRVTLYTSGEQIKARVSEDEVWQFNPVLEGYLGGFGISVPPGIAEKPIRAAYWVTAQLQSGASQVRTDAYVSLFGSQELLGKAQLTEESATLDFAVAV